MAQINWHNLITTLAMFAAGVILIIHGDTQAGFGALMAGAGVASPGGVTGAKPVVPQSAASIAEPVPSAKT